MLDALLNQPTVQPDPLPCPGECGVMIPWVSRTTRLGAQIWVRGNTPCPRCKSVAARSDLEQRRARAIEHSGMPPKLRGWSLARHTLQGAQESPEDFHRRCRCQGMLLGVSRLNAPAYRALLLWVEEMGRQSLYLHGPVGTGKSTFAAAAVAALLEPREESSRRRTDEELEDHFGDNWVNVPESRRWVRTMAPQVDALYIDEPELMARVRLSWSGDKDPLKRVASVRLLILDDMGLELQAATGDRRIQVASALERLIDYRYKHHLPMLITSNLPWEDVVDAHRFGRRVGDRLAEMVDGNHWAVLGGSWRRTTMRAAAREEEA